MFYDKMDFKWSKFKTRMKIEKTYIIIVYRSVFDMFIDIFINMWLWFDTDGGEIVNSQWNDSAHIFYPNNTKI